ncbi:hypothetical protein BGZ96_003324 [Linnemannia gamsii]|uniref:Uncharacterized protein n=1 Tax=Linnemannia gamsii TaxID=64522 RepID=A0ABQ7K7Z9_9FUNG|nr:hypothetical protein BGZ96_003324 [Linnemannia gamsii]
MEATATPYSNGTTAETAPSPEDVSGIPKQPRDNTESLPTTTTGTDTTSTETPSHFEGRGNLDTLVAAALKPQAADEYPQRHHSSPQRYEPPDHSRSISNNINNEQILTKTLKKILRPLPDNITTITTQQRLRSTLLNPHILCKNSQIQHSSSTIRSLKSRNSTRKEIAAHGDKALPEMNLRATMTWTRIACLANRFRAITAMAACTHTRFITTIIADSPGTR